MTSLTASLLKMGTDGRVLFGAAFENGARIHLSTLRASKQRARPFKVCKRSFGLDHFWLNYDMGDIMRNARPRARGGGHAFIRIF